MTEPKITVKECAESLTGYEEQAIEKAFGKPLEELAEGSLSGLLRALAFAVFKRSGQDSAEAKRSALELTRKQAEEFFADDPDEVMEDDAVAEAVVENED